MKNYELVKPYDKFDCVWRAVVFEDECMISCNSLEWTNLRVSYGEE
jgi:hypothetical protein